MIHGETVYVIHPTQIGVDEFNAPIYDEDNPEIEQVDNVLVSPGDQNSKGEDVIDSMRPDGVVIKYTLHFPKTYYGSLAHLKIIVRDETCAVVGFPDRYTPENTPGVWNMPVHVQVVEG